MAHENTKGPESLEAALKQYTVYVLGAQGNMDYFNMAPAGKSAVALDIQDPQNGAFAGLVNQLDGLSYGDKNLAMPKWVQLDCASLPGAIVGLAKPIHVCPPQIVDLFDIPDRYHSLIPVSEYCASPGVDGTWTGHTCASLIQGQGIGLLTKIIALLVVQAKKFRGVAQYTNPSVKLHTKISPLSLMCAMGTFHDDPQNTFIYQHSVHADHLMALLRGTKQTTQTATLFIDPSDLEGKQTLQENITKGKKVSIIYPGHVYDCKKLLVPITIQEP